MEILKKSWNSIRWPIYENRIKADINYLMMEMTKITDRVGILESEANDETEETKSVGAVHIEQLHIGKLFWQFITTTEFVWVPFSGLSDFIQSQRYGDGRPSNDNSDQVINQKLTKEDFNVTVIEISFNLIINAPCKKNRIKI